jgi:hypothetical protein
MKTAINRSDSDNGIDGLFGYDASDVESNGKVEVLGSGNLAKVIGDFGNYLNLCSDISFTYQKQCDFLKNYSLILTPNEIDQFLDASYKIHKDVTSLRFEIGYFTNQLIKEHYNLGNQDLTLNLPSNSYITYLLYDFSAPQNVLHSITINGDLGKNFGQCMKHFDIKVNGNITGTNALHSAIYVNLDVNGDIGGFGSRSVGLNARVKGNIHTDQNNVLHCANSTLILNDINKIENIFSHLKRWNCEHWYDSSIALESKDEPRFLPKNEKTIRLLLEKEDGTIREVAWIKSSKNKNEPNYKQNARFAKSFRSN